MEFNVVVTGVKGFPRSMTGKSIKHINEHPANKEWQCCRKEREIFSNFLALINCNFAKSLSMEPLLFASEESESYSLNLSPTIFGYLFYSLKIAVFTRNKRSLYFSYSYSHPSIIICSGHVGDAFQNFISFIC